MATRNLPRFIRRDFEAGSSVTTLIKDLGLIQEEAASGGVPLPFGTLAAQRFQEADGQGWAGHDMSILVRLWEEPAGVTVSSGTI